MIYKKPKDAQEVQECLETQIVDVITKKNEDEETYKKAAMFLNGQKAEGCLKINCLPVGRTADTTALRLAMCYACLLYTSVLSPPRRSSDLKHL